MTKILIVDDSISVRKALERILLQRDNHVTTAESAERALEILSDALFDIIIADVVMPGKNGFELCQEIKASPRHSNIPVMLISGIVNSGVIEQAKDVGALDVISKPFTPTDLFPKIDAAINGAGTADVAESAVVEPETSKPRETDVAETPPAMAEPSSITAQPDAAGGVTNMAEPISTSGAEMPAETTTEIPATDMMPPPIPTPNITAMPSAEATVHATTETTTRTATEVKSDIVPGVTSAIPNARPSTPTPAPPTVQSAPSPTQSPTQSQALDVHLQPFLEKSGIDSALLVSVHGQRLSHVGESMGDAEALASFCNSLVSVGSVLGNNLKAAPLHSVILEYKNATVLMNRVTKNTVLLIPAKDAAVLGAVRYLIKRQLPHIAKVLKSEQKA